MWLFYAILSSLFASIMTIIMKMGLKNIDSNLMLALRSTIVVVFVWIVVLSFSKQSGIKNITRKEWLYILLSAIFTTLTWVFYFLALKNASVNKVLAVDKLSIVFTVLLSVFLLKEKISFITIIGIIILIIGSCIIVFN